MSPTLFSYKGISIRIYGLDHKPIHVHANVKGNYEMKVIFKMKSGKVLDVTYENVKARKPFTPAMMRDLKKLVNEFGQKMADDFITVVEKNQEVHGQIVIHKIYDNKKG